MSKGWIEWKEAQEINKKIISNKRLFIGKIFLLQFFFFFKPTFRRIFSLSSGFKRVNERGDRKKKYYMLPSLNFLSPEKRILYLYIF